MGSDCNLPFPHCCAISGVMRLQRHAQIQMFNSHIGSAADLQSQCPTVKRQGSAATTQRSYTRNTAPTATLRAINIAAMRCDTHAANDKIKNKSQTGNYMLQSGVFEIPWPEQSQR